MISLDSKLELVRVHYRGATVRRRARVLTGSDGRFPTQVEIAGLPLSLDDSRVSLRADDDRIVVTGVRVSLHIKPRNEVIEEPNTERLKELRREIEVHQARSRQLELEIGMLESMEVPERPEPEEGQAPPPSPMTARLALEQFVNSSVEERLATLREARKELREMREEQAAIERAVTLLSSSKTARADEITKMVTARLEVEGIDLPDEVVLVLDYTVPGARWAPQYQCRISKLGTSAEIQMRAVVCQASGEDWRGVKLELSTADPVLWTDLPELSSIRIGKAQPQPAAIKGFRPAPQGASQLFSDFDRDYAVVRRVVPSPAAWTPPYVQAPSAPDLVDSAPSVNRMSDKGGYARDHEAEELDLLCEPTPDAVASYAPPPPPAYAPAPQAMPVPMKEAAVPRRQEEAKMKKSAPPRPSTAPGGAGIGRGGEGFGGLPSEPAAAQSWAFSKLRLRSFDDALRGKLNPVDVRSAYLEDLGRSHLNVGFDVLSLVQTAYSRALEVLRLGLPSGSSDVRQAAGWFDYAYQSASCVDIPADGVFHSVPVDTREAGCEMEYVVVPREDPSVYRVASLHNASKGPLLPGQTEVYLGGEFILSTPLPTVAPGERFRLGLGVEQAIKCARNTHFTETRSGAAVVATAELWHEIEIEIANNLKREIKLEVRERIPCPDTDAEVVVEEIAGDVSPPWMPYDQKELNLELTGGRRWRVSVPAAEKMTLKAKYVVKIYANNELVGGNRREA